MVNPEKDIYLLETEIKPNRYASLVLFFTVIGTAFCWIINEIGLFRVGKWEMRIGSLIPLVILSALLLAMRFQKPMMKSPYTKWLVLAATTVTTLSINILLTFHTTIMLLFPIFMAMLYRSKKLGFAAMGSSVFATVFTPVVSYLLKVWDIPLFEELIGIGTGGVVLIENATYESTLIGILKIVLYLVLPRLVMVGSCSLLMFHVISIGVNHVDYEILLDKMNHRDTLTGLYNQNYFQYLLENPRLTGKAGIIYFDVNGLKSINDRFGHELGDLLLKRCAHSLTGLCDEEKVFGFRLGGDEFLLLIEGASEDILRTATEEWKKALARINEENKTLHNGLVCSMASGYALGDMSALEDLVKKADSRMYENKAKMKLKSAYAE